MNTSESNKTLHVGNQEEITIKVAKNPISGEKTFVVVSSNVSCSGDTQICFMSNDIVISGLKLSFVGES